MNYAIVIISSVLSGILGVIISTIYYKKSQRRKEKIDLITQLIGNRYDLIGDKFTESMNSILIIFHDSEKVLIKLKEFYDVSIRKDKTEEMADYALNDLFKALVSDVKLENNQLNDNFLLRVFNPK